jgi:molecular chaperone DnaK
MLQHVIKQVAKSRITIESSGGLTKDEIEKMVKDAEIHAAEDKKHKEKVEAVNQANSLIHTVEKNLFEYSDKIDEKEKENIKQDIDDLKQCLENDDVAEIKEKTANLTKSSMKIGELLYKSSEEKKNSTEDSDNNSGSEEEVKAEYEDLSKKN